MSHKKGTAHFQNPLNAAESHQISHCIKKAYSCSCIKHELLPCYIYLHYIYTDCSNEIPLHIDIYISLSSLHIYVCFYARVGEHVLMLSHLLLPRKPRGEAKKCRKVYGMEKREMWCTACRWKKACQRFID